MAAGSRAQSHCCVLSTLWNTVPLVGIHYLLVASLHESKAPVIEDQILTIKDVAAILKLAEKTVYSMAQDGEVPAFKVRGQWRIRRVDFENWIAKQAAAATDDSDAG